MAEKILYNQAKGVAFITLNNPEKLNCMGMEMLRQLDDAINQAAADKAVRAVLIRGAGDRAFSTGADLKEYQALTPSEEKVWLRFGNTLFEKIETLPKPTVALIDGYAIGGGLELALACDFRFGTDATEISLPELRHGWLPGWGGMARVRRLAGEARAKEIVMLNEKIPAMKALNYGLITRILAKDSMDEQLSAFLAHLASIDPFIFQRAKSELTHPDDRPKY